MQTDRLRGSSLAVLACVLAGTLALSACATTGDDSTESNGSSDRAERAPLATGLDASANADPFPSTYRGLPRENMAIVGGTVFDGAGRRFENGVVVITDGRVVAVGDAATAIPAGHRNVDARGRFVTPGIIDTHSHLASIPRPACRA